MGESLTPQASTSQGVDWRRGLRRGIALTLLLKLIALILLKSLFFSGEHRVHVDDARVDAHLFPQTQGHQHD